MSLLPLGRNFTQETGNHRGKALEVFAKDSQMIAWYGLDLNLSGQVRPYRGGIIREIRDGLSPYELYFGGVVMGPVAHQGFVCDLTGALHRWSMRCPDRQLTWRVPIPIARNVQPPL